MIRITQIGPGHIEPAFALLCRFFAEEGFSTPPDRIRSSLQTFLTEPGIAVFLAWREATAVGMATMASRPSIEHGLYAEIEDLYVLPSARGAGVGAALIEAAVQWCEERGCSSVEVCITSEGEAAHGLTRFYEKFGFADEGRRLIAKNCKGDSRITPTSATLAC